MLAGAAGLVVLLAWLMPDALAPASRTQTLLASAQLVAVLVLVGSGLAWRRRDGGDGPQSWREGLSHAAIWGGLLLLAMVAHAQRDGLARLWAGLSGVAR